MLATYDILGTPSRPPYKIVEIVNVVGELVWRSVDVCSSSNIGKRGTSRAVGCTSYTVRRQSVLASDS